MLPGQCSKYTVCVCVTVCLPAVSKQAGHLSGRQEQLKPTNPHKHRRVHVPRPGLRPNMLRSQMKAWLWELFVEGLRGSSLALQEEEEVAAHRQALLAATHSTQFTPSLHHAFSLQRFQFLSELYSQSCKSLLESHAPNSFSWFSLK